MTEPRSVRTDARGRLSLGEPDTAFLLWDQPDGAMLLEPAITISKVEAALLSNEGLQDRIERAQGGVGLVQNNGGRRRASVAR